MTTINTATDTGSYTYVVRGTNIRATRVLALTPSEAIATVRELEPLATDLTATAVR